MQTERSKVRILKQRLASLAISRYMHQSQRSSPRCLPLCLDVRRRGLNDTGRYCMDEFHLFYSADVGCRNNRAYAISWMKRSGD